MLTPEDKKQLADDRKVCEMATAGPWDRSNTYIGENQTIRRRPRDGEIIDADFVVDDGSAGGEYTSHAKECDFAFIASARTRWPAALDIIERLRDELLNQHAYNEGLQEHIGDLLEAIAPIMNAPSNTSFKNWKRLKVVVNHAKSAISVTNDEVKP